MRTKMMAVILTALAILAIAAPASAGRKYDCTPNDLVQAECPRITDALRIAERSGSDSHSQTVTLEAVNLNVAQSVQVVVTYQANRLSSQPRTIAATELGPNDVWQISFDVPRWRNVDGQVIAYIEDLHCDGNAESVRLS